MAGAMAGVGGGLSCIHGQAAAREASQANLSCLGTATCCHMHRLPGESHRCRPPGLGSAGAL